jgi:hypothetical protein
MQWSTLPNKYVQEVPLAKRKKQSQKVASEFPDRVAVVVQSGSDELTVQQMKFLVPRSTTVSFFFAKLRDYTNYRGGPLPPDKAIFLLVGDRQLMFPMSHTMCEVQESQTSNDGMLYVWVMPESTFGGA